MNLKDKIRNKETVFGSKCHSSARFRWVHALFEEIRRGIDSEVRVQKSGKTVQRNSVFLTVKLQWFDLRILEVLDYRKSLKRRVQVQTAAERTWLVRMSAETTMEKHL